MIRYIKNASIDPIAWDQCLEQAVNGRIYGYSWYLDIMAQNWDALVLGDYEAVMPLVYKNRFAFKQIYQPFLTQQLGVFSAQALSNDLVNAFMAAIPKKFQVIDFYLHSEHPLDLLTDFSKTSKTNLIIHLLPTYPQVYQHYSKNTRRNLKKSQAYQLKVAHDISVSELIRMFRESKGDLAGVTEQHYHQIQTLMEFILQKKMGQLWAIRDENDDLCAGAFIAYSHGRIIDLFPTSSAVGKEKRAMFYLLDHLIQQYAEQPLILDFEGSMIASIARFYKGFGAAEETYHHLSRRTLPKVLQGVYQWYTSNST